MRIAQSIAYNTVQTKRNGSQPRVESTFSREKNTTVNFKGSISGKIYNALPLLTGKLKEYSIREYSRLNPLEKMMLRAEYNTVVKPFDNDFFKNAEDIHDFVSDCMKESLNSKYGKDKYIVIPIGRSVSSISKVLGYKIGEDKIKNLPLSEAWKFNKPDGMKEISKEELKSFQTYLDSIGLSKDFMKTTDKTVIVTDFTASGDSLCGAESLLKSDALFGKDAPIKAIGTEFLIPVSKNLIGFKISLKTYLLNSKFKPFAFVNRNTNLTKTESSVKNPKKADRATKLFWFKLLDNYMTGKKADPKKIQNMECLPPEFGYYI